MSDESYSFEATRTRLEEILVQVRKKDTSLEQSLELFEEGVRLANLCNELIDQTSWRAAEPAVEDPGSSADDEAQEPVEAESSVDTSVADDERS
jgi:exodeoxyribonuclease VII small subunit